VSEEKKTRSRISKIDELDPTVVNESLTRQVAAILLTNVSVTQCAKQLAITPAAVRRIIESPRYKELVETTAEEELGPALAKAKSQLAKLTTKAVAAIERALGPEASNRDALQAATIVLKSVGLHEEKEVQQDTQINIVMPTGVEVPITYEVKEEES
jgi:hypothetical protein